MNEADDDNGQRNGVVGAFYGCFIMLVVCGVFWIIYEILKWMLML